MSNLRLAEMDLADMLDVLHYFYEEDSNFVSEEHGRFMETKRINVYERLYEEQYRYRVFSDTSATEFDEDGNVIPFSPSNQDVKPYIPPTEFNPDSADPFGGVLDTPIG